MAGHADYMLHFRIRLSSRGSGQTPKTHSDSSVLTGINMVLQTEAIIIMATISKNS